MRRRGRRRRIGRHTDNHERWLITYADLITLLMIFFVVLFAMSQIDARKYETLAQALTLQFRNADSLLELGTGLTGDLDRDKHPEPSESREPRKDESPEEEQKRREQELQDLLKVIQAYVEDNRLETQVFVADTPMGIAIRLSDQFLFDLGKADLKPPSLPVLDRLSSLFSTLDTTISIQGHTDSLPIMPGSQFKDNWGLSTGRALSVLRYFVDVKKLNEDIFEVAGYADTRPVAPNTSESNRQKNRRVEILVLRSQTAGAPEASTP